jgi:hypothetical protein
VPLAVPVRAEEQAWQPPQDAELQQKPSVQAPTPEHWWLSVQPVPTPISVVQLPSVQDTPDASSASQQKYADAAQSSSRTPSVQPPGVVQSFPSQR